MPHLWGKMSGQKPHLSSYSLSITVKEQLMPTFVKLPPPGASSIVKSHHSLEIEKGGHQRPYVKPKDRVCQTCKLETEDEAYFLLRRPSYLVLRDILHENEVKR